MVSATRIQEDRALALACVEIGRNKAERALHSSVVKTLCRMGRKVETLEDENTLLRGQLEEALQENEKLVRQVRSFRNTRKMLAEDVVHACAEVGKVDPLIPLPPPLGN